jgi:hypothetical protein
MGKRKKGNEILIDATTWAKHENSILNERSQHKRSHTVYHFYEGLEQANL